MTVCIAAKVPDGIWLASDSQLTDGNVKDLCGHKWWEVGGIIVAYAGDDAYASILRGKLYPERYGGQELLRWVEHELYPEARDLVDDEDDLPEMMAIYSGQIVLFGRGSYETQRECAAIGSGALGALCAYKALETSGLTPEERIRKAVEITCEHADGCGGPVQVRWQPS